MTFELKEEYINAGAMILIKLRLEFQFLTLLMIYVNRI